jgi:hypothetical protein
VLHAHGARVRVYLAGDLHHYRRHARADDTQKITAGGGGSFLHPTHEPRVPVVSGDFHLAPTACYPSPEVSRRLGLRNLAFPVFNPRFALLSGAVYALVVLAWSGGGLGLLAPVAVWIAIVAFTDTHSRPYRWLAGSLHAAAHLATAALLAQEAAALATTWAWSRGPVAASALAALVLLAAGGLAGSAILGVYLFLSLNGFGRHSNEAFSALRIPHYKNFVRLRIDAAGTLTLFPIGIDRVPLAWKAAESPAPHEPALVPDDPRATAARSIEPAIRIPAAVTPPR